LYHLAAYHRAIRILVGLQSMGYTEIKAHSSQLYQAVILFDIFQQFPSLTKYFFNSWLIELHVLILVQIWCIYGGAFMGDDLGDMLKGYVDEAIESRYLYEIEEK